ncbi:MAG: hypothetical protein CL816_07440 [Coxiellaceae bacterium]|nr:hypothetical protein [Coxiellaceae bacterium]|tara:strand:- start:7783 stop:8640 length:858 start_codon:yes stop_codon:yes gene_type:complete
MGISKWLRKKAIDHFTKQVSPSRGYLCDFDRLSHEIRPADVLLVEGCNRISLIINKITKSAWSHSALYIGRIHDIEDPKLREAIHQQYHGAPHERLVIESHIGQGTYIAPLSKYRNEHLRICRPTGISSNDAQAVICYAISRVGKRYDVRQFIDLGRFLLKSRLIPSRLGSILFTDKPNSTAYEICSEMIANAFTSINFPILPLIKKNDADDRYELIRRNTRMTTPSDFDYSPFFDIIKYPFFQLSQNSQYRDLPWSENNITHDGEKSTPIKKNNSSDSSDAQPS